MQDRKPLICSIGDLVTDVIVHLDRDPQRGTDTAARIERVRGGSAANVTAAAVAAGARGRFVGQVGDDHAGETLVADLEENGVEALVTRRGTSGTIVVLVDSEGERSFLTDRGASLHLASVAGDALDGVDVLHVPLYSLLSGSLAEATQDLLGEAVEREIAITLSTSSLSALREFGREPFHTLVKNVAPAIVFANELEARQVLAGHPWFTHARATVVTSGARPARYTRPDGFDVRVRPDDVDVVDSTGAGDTFTGGFLAHWCQNRNVMTGDDAASEDAVGKWLGAAHRLAGQVLGVPGASIPSQT